MNKPHRAVLPRPPPSGRTNLASCIVATIFLIFIAIIILIVFFTVFKPKQPKISVNAVQLPTFSVTNGTVNFTFSQYLTVTNPNRASFTHYDSSLQLIYSGNQVGFMFIPAGKIDSGRTQYMTAKFSVESFPLSSDPGNLMDLPTTTFGDGVVRLGPSFAIESKVKLAGRVKILEFFTHHVEVDAGCRVSIASSDGSVLGFHC